MGRRRGIEGGERERGEGEGRGRGERGRGDREGGKIGRGEVSAHNRHTQENIPHIADPL